MLKVVGAAPDVWNDINSVKSYRPLNQMEWFAFKPERNTQLGIGVSVNSEIDRGIRFSWNSVGIYLDSKRTYYGSPEKPTPEGWNTYFGGKLKIDPNNKSPAMQVAVDYTTNTLYYKHPRSFALKFVLPQPFHGKPLYAQAQVWNSNTGTLVPAADECTPFYQCCADNYFNAASFYGFNNKPGQVSQHVTKTTLRVSGDGWNGVNSVKTIRALAQDEWIGVVTTRGSQYGIGVSITAGGDGGIRFNQNTVGFYYDSKRSYWGSPETPTPGGLNKSFASRLVRDPRGFYAMWVKVDYKTNTLWLRYPYMKPISFGLPDSFKGKPVFGHYQVWNSGSLRYAYPIPYNAITSSASIIAT
eukprot:g8522.t1